MTTDTVLPELVGTLANLPKHTQETILAYGAACARTALQSSEAQGLKRDAERYRLLRDRENSLETRQYDKGIYNGPSCYHNVEGIRELKWGAELDAAIDAAMEKQ